MRHYAYLWQDFSVPSISHGQTGMWHFLSTVRSPSWESTILFNKIGPYYVIAIFRQTFHSHIIVGYVYAHVNRIWRFVKYFARSKLFYCVLNLFLYSPVQFSRFITSMFLHTSPQYAFSSQRGWVGSLWLVLSVWSIVQAGRERKLLLLTKILELYT
jgi:hypothetical protein